MKQKVATNSIVDFQNIFAQQFWRVDPALVNNKTKGGFSIKFKTEIRYLKIGGLSYFYLIKL